MGSSTVFELVGYAASLLVAISLMMRSVVRLRVINLLGSLVFSIYGLLIGSYPVAAMNAFIVAINIYYLTQIYRTKSRFAVIDVASDAPYLDAFLDQHRPDMLLFFPNLPAQLDGAQRASFLLRDAVPVGVVITEPAGENGLRVLADYVVPGYRDLQPGRFFYTQYAPSLREEGFTHFCAAPGIPKHNRYLQNMGFNLSPGGHYCRSL